MNNSSSALWKRFQECFREYPALGLSLDISRVPITAEFTQKMAPSMKVALTQMKALEAGAIANPDENRMVGHYWLRAPELAPTGAITDEIKQTLSQLQSFVAEVHSGKIKGANGPFKNVLIIGIGGSALGPQFVAHALSRPGQDRMHPYFFDNTDPDGMDKVFAQLSASHTTLQDALGKTLCVVISKSGGTPETRNGMLEAAARYRGANLEFGNHAVAITGVGSQLDQYAIKHQWIRRFPMWDWVGGRTSETSAVGLLPAALQGIDIHQLLAGAKACDEITRTPNHLENPAALMALSWYSIGEGRGTKDMVVLPYKDRLELLSRYLQQLVMESLGKEQDLSGRVVNQGIAVYGNKGSTDQHAYVQQLRDGVANFFAVFIQVLKDRDLSQTPPLEVEPGTTSGDFLNGFLLGTRQALYENGRSSLTITVADASAFTVGVLIALFERAVGLYASLIGINAYHQPGVEAGKKAAASILQLQRETLAWLTSKSGSAFSADEIAIALNQPNSAETIFHLLRHLAANQRGIALKSGSGPSAKYEAR